MVFNSLSYAVFLPIVVVLYWRLRRRSQNLLILVASYFFYAYFDWRFLGLLILSTGLDFWFGHALSRAGEGRRKRWLLASLGVNLGILGVFKYYGFFVDSAIEILDHFGFEGTAPALKVLLPVGISFYTFHGISYVFDIYRGEIEPTENLIDYACFVAFFPQLVAGPIGRATIQLPQFERDRVKPNAEAVRSGLLLILLGLFKKVVIADSVAGVANTAFNNPRAWGWVTLTTGAVAFSLQIYGDFSGYSDIARGSSRLLGIELPPNFAEPYLSKNITEFWRRWHISLSNWLRDYLYIPLGGNRGSSLATYRNLMVTMLLGGLWHGASWTFVVWGGGHGFLLAAHRFWSVRRGRPEVDPADHRPAILRRLGTFALVTFLWVLFRAPNFSAARAYLGALRHFPNQPFNADDVLLVAMAALTVLAIDLLHRHVRTHGLDSVLPGAPLLRPVAVGGAVLAIIIWSGGAPVPFIYFQF